MTARKISAPDCYFDALNTLDQEAFLACFSKEAEMHDPFGSRPYVGAKGLEKWFSGFRNTWKKFSISREEIFACGNRAAVKWSVQGEANNGKRATFSGIDVFTIDEDGQIVRMDGFWDAPAMLAQIR